MWTLQSRTKMFYSNDVLISSYDFLEMMLLDGCFVVELLRHLGCNENVVDLDDSIFPRPWLIRVLIRDLLREDNQLPHFLLQSLFPWSQCDDGEGTYTSPILALKDFGLSFPTASETINKSRNFEGKHLLDLFRLSFLPFDHASLLERRGVAIQRGRRNLSNSIFRIPYKLVGVNDNAQQPELVPIGRYHRGNEHLQEFEEHKWSFLEKFLSRTRAFGMELRDYLESCHLGSAGDVFDDDDPIFTRAWLIPVLIRDLLKLENQLPLFVLDSLFTGSHGHEIGRIDSLPTMALKVFNLVFPNRWESINKGEDLNAKHFLVLLRLSILPPKPVASYPVQQEYRPSDQSIQCATQLRPSGIKFKPKNSYSFLEVDFRNRVIEIPSITINDFTSTVLINWVALEQCLENSSKYFTDYVSFVNCLINQPRDVAFLCSDGITTRFSQDNQYVANFLNHLGKNIDFNIRHCYLSKQIRDAEAYRSSNWATMMRTYFSSPWSFISLSSAIFLISLTTVQTIMSVLAYKS
ncbi:Uncharacterized protein TCM_041464 [Theobroma cacao]|uniref:Uncharacterized protein n=1 Tax=Theobroma cacao TaxID=3641 RepID=A0A061GWC0_THECC|nr:Uncharacterized protein TCM_041464 [Theobroma cacao]